jgi:hypothetical protein
VAKRRGNPNWGKPDIGVPPAAPSAFEKFVKSLHLSPSQYQSSRVLREWVRKNKDQKYVPQELLEAFGFEPQDSEP